MNNYRLEMVKRKEARTGNDLDCLYVMIDNNSNRQIADVYIPLDDIFRAMSVQSGTMTVELEHNGKLYKGVLREEQSHGRET